MAILITDQQFMILGLESAGFTGWERTSNAANVERFRCWYGPRPKGFARKFGSTDRIV